MSYSPVTPAKGAGDPSQGMMGLASDKLSSASKGNEQAALHQSSPASTHVETTPGNSVPATPLGGKDHDSMSGIIRSTSSLHLTPLRDGVMVGQESPDVKVQSIAPLYVLDQDTVGGHPGQLYKQAEVARGKPTHQEHTVSDVSNTGAMGNFMHQPASGPLSPGEQDVKELICGAAPQRERGAPGFVVHGKDSGADDPFLSPSRRQHGSAPDAELGTPQRKSMALIATPGSRSQGTPSRLRQKFIGTPRHGQVASPGIVVRRTPDKNGNQSVFSPRENRIIGPISADNAQAVLPPDACVFVANLSSSRTDDELQESVTDAFKGFGSVYVKIRRDARMMPYAFCQYENVKDAEAAIQLGKNALIDGRRCRTEQARVNRSLYMSRVTGGPISQQEAQRALQEFGPIEKTWESSLTEKEIYQLPEGIWVKFAYFQDCRDAQSFFRENTEFRLDQPPPPPDAPMKTNRQAITFTSPASSSVGPSPNRTVFWDRQTPWKKIEERCSVFVGGLNTNVTQEQLMSFFGKFGHVVTAQLISKPSLHCNGVNVFGFVEFANEDGATSAIESHDKHMMDGVRIRVERKQSMDPYSRQMVPRTPRAGGYLTGGSPISRRPGREDSFTGYDRRAVQEKSFDQPLVYNNPQVARPADGLDRRPSAGDSRQALSMSNAVYQMPYAYYPSQYPPVNGTPPYANYGHGIGDEDSVPGLSPSGPTLAQGGYSHAGYYPQGREQMQSSPSGALQTQLTGGAGMHQAMQTQYLGQQALGPIPYSQSQMAYAQYPGAYYQYPPQSTGTMPPMYHYMYPQNEEHSHMAVHSAPPSVNPADSTESR
ncbi:MAG: hypothetical protein M1819_000832 [Sarea resinae]|nr:MAG: hypothetical protein M1819_000832 [Sarea resinae]